MATTGFDAAPPGEPQISGSARTEPQMGVQNAARAQEHYRRYVTPSFAEGNYQAHEFTSTPQNLPSWYPQGTSQLPVSYVGPSAVKDDMVRRQTIRNAIEQTGGDVIRTDPIQDSEVQYLKYMEDMSELAKFDQYVESFIDPRQPGSMKFLMEVYPEYVNRRLQQAHADYEYALRNQMIDSWGINTFDDLYFKYMVDQGKLSGPRLKRDGKRLADRYAPGILSPWAFATKFEGMDKLGLPFTSAQTGRRPPKGSKWEVSRSNMPFSRGGTRMGMAQGIYSPVSESAATGPSRPFANADAALVDFSA